MPGVQYEDRVIEAQSYKSDSGRWRPQALVSIHEGGTHLVPAPLERVFHTEADADHVITQHLQGRLTHYELIGRYALGLKIDEARL